MTNFTELWMRVLGTPPPPEQFAIWGELYSEEIIRKAILKTAVKNQKLNGTMSQDYRERFACKVMQRLLDDPQKAEGQKIREGSNV
jgi:hypothetical protein